MQPRLLGKLWVLALPLIAAACSKPARPASATPARVVPATPTASAPAAGSLQNGPRFTGEVKQGQQFEKTFAPEMVFRLEPYGGNDSGWTIRIAPGIDSAASAMDCIGAVEVPLHGDTTLEIEPPEDGASKNPSWRQREFDFVATSEDCKTAWVLMNDANYNSKLAEKDREQTSAKLGQILRRHGELTILDLRLGPATPQNSHGTLEWMKFEVDVSGASAQSTSRTANTAKGSAIRSVELKPFIETHIAELNPDLADLATECGDGQKPLQSLAAPLYGDLDGDGQEEAAIEGWSCLSGNGGADFSGVLKLTADGTLVVLSLEPLPKTFKGRNPYDGLRGHMVLEIKDGRLHEVYGIYKDADLNCCPEGGSRRFVYRWDGHRFALDDIIDVPAEKSGN